MNDRLKVSVVVPIYNVEKYLKKCVDSLLEQTYKNIEIILVDDGATDSCPEICDYYKSIDSRIIAVHKQNGGLSDARNEGIKYMSGDYVAFVDSDDYVSPYYIETLVVNAEKYNADVSICNFERVYENDEPVNKRPNNDIVRQFNKHDSLTALFDDELKMQFTIACSKIIRSSIMKSVTFPKGRIYEDSATAHKIYNLIERTVYVDSQLYFYLLRGGSIKTSEKFLKTDMIDAIYDKLTFFKSYNDPILLRNSYYDYLTCLMGVYSRINSDTPESKTRKATILEQFKMTLSEMKDSGIKLGTKRKMRIVLFKASPWLYSKSSNMVRRVSH